MKEHASIIIATWGTLGDLIPYMELAKGLKAIGHHPIIAAPAEYQQIVEKEGINFRSMRPSIADLQQQLGLDSSSIWRKFSNPLTGPFFLIRKMLMPNLRQSYEDILNISEHADLIVTHGLAYGAMIAAHKRKIPQVLGVLSPLALLSAHDQPVTWLMQLFEKVSPQGRLWVSNRIRVTLLLLFSLLFLPIYKLRRQVGLSRPHNIRDAVFSTTGTICFWSPIFAKKQIDFPHNALVAGFPFKGSAKGKNTLPQGLTHFLQADKKPLVFTLGSLDWSISNKFYLESVKAARKLGYRSVVLGADAVTGLEMADDIYLCKFIDHSTLFPHAAAVIHHGGLGTLSEALRSGCPQLIVPLANDQPDNAHKAEKLGVAKILSIKNYKGDIVCKALSDLLNDPSISERAVFVSKKITTENGIDNAVLFIQKILNANFPLEIKLSEEASQF